jgi:hypothetical protein
MSPADDEVGNQDGGLNGGFLGRWAKRKQAVQLETQQATARTPASGIDEKHEVAPTSTPQGIVTGEKPDEAQLPLPSLDDILPGGDVSMFLAKHVPDSLRNLALRKAWALDPEISTFIEIAENQWDFNNPDSIPGFSSRLEGIDLKAMVERVFNNVAPPEEKTSELVSEILKKEAVEPEKAPTEISENIIIDTKSNEISEEPSEKAHENTRDKNDKPDHVALQQNSTESVFYDIPKKRHGSALPS